MNKLLITILILLSQSSVKAAINNSEKACYGNEIHFKSNPDSTGTDIRITCLPDKEMFTINIGQQSEQPTFVDFFDYKGQKVATAEFKLKKTHSLDLQGLSPGKYTVKIKKGVRNVTHIINVPNRGAKGTLEHYTKN